MLFWKSTKITGKVSILIPTMFDSRYTIELCLKSIEKYTDYPEYEIIVCDAGVDNVTQAYLLDLVSANKIKLIKATDWKRPKDDLVRSVTTEYYCLMHDDIQIKKNGWLTRRLLLMNNNRNNAIVGTIAENYNNTKRFFPLGLLVKTEVSRELGLVWGKEPEKGYDTGSLAYIKFFSQNTYHFVSYKISRDIRHFSEMTWPKYHTSESFPGIDKKLAEREMKIKIIQNILEKEKY